MYIIRVIHFHLYYFIYFLSVPYFSTYKESGSECPCTCPAAPFEQKQDEGSIHPFVFVYPNDPRSSPDRTYPACGTMCSCAKLWRSQTRTSASESTPAGANAGVLAGTEPGRQLLTTVSAIWLVQRGCAAKLVTP